MKKLELLSSEDRMNVPTVILTQYQSVTDGFTVASTALCIASYADAL